MRVVDLTQPLGPATAPWPPSAPLHAEIAGSYEPDGAYFRRLELDEHLGTHIDAPAHFHPGGRFVHELSADELVLPALVLDCRAACGGDPDYAVGAGELAAFEAERGRIPAGSAVLACTGWDAHLGDPSRYLGEPLRFPGYGVDAARVLVERGVAAIGIDTLSVDRGADEACPVHHTTSPAGVWHLEGLVALDQLPPTGATLVVGALPLVDGSGTPARVLALVP